MPRHWLMKTEPETFSWADLVRSTGQTTMWEGVRNYQARNLLRDRIKNGDRVLFYHSNAKPPAVVGTAVVVREGYPDPTQFDPRSEYFDPKSTRETPRWYAVDIRMDRELERPVPLPELRATKGLQEMKLLQRGMRLSVQPVTAREWRIVIRLGGLEPEPPRRR